MIFTQILMIHGWSVSCEIVLRWMSTSVQVMVWCHHTIIPGQCWRRSMSPYGVIKPISPWSKTWQTIISYFTVTSHQCNGISSHRQLDRLLNCLFRLTAENIGGLFSQRTSNAENVSMSSLWNTVECVRNFQTTQTTLYWVLWKTSCYLTQAWHKQ